MTAHTGYDVTSFAFIASVSMLAVVYLLIVFERLNRAVIALFGAAALVVMGILTQDEAIAAVDFNTVGFLTGMMIVVAAARKSGLFEYIAVRAAQLAKGSPGGILAALALVTAVLSAGLDNVTTVLLIVPVTIAICGHLKVSPYPFLFTQVIASNIGGTATLIGDPPNILIGSATHLSFNDFIMNLAPVVVVILALQLAVNHLIWGIRLSAKPENRAWLMGLNPNEQIKDRVMFRFSIAVIAAILVGFVIAEHFHLHAATIALFGAAVMLILENWPHAPHTQHENVLGVLRDVEWITIFFFIGLFIVIGAVEKAGAISYLADALAKATQGDMKLAAGGILWVSAFASAIIDNIPFVATMIPLLKQMAPTFGGVSIDPLWWSLALGACLGGNGTLVGASANLVVAGLAEKSGVRFSFLKFTLMGMPLMIGSVAISHLYVLWRYF